MNRQNAKQMLVLMLLFVGHLAFGQTDKHVEIPGTKCSLVPPSGFVAAASFGGFQNQKTGASIMINEVPAPYQQLVEGFTAAALKTRGMTLLSKQTIDFSSSEATLIKVAQVANGTAYLKQILIFGDETGTVMVNGIYPESSKSSEEQIKDALFSTVYNKNQEENSLAAAPFTVDVAGTAYKLVKFAAGNLLYCVDGQIPSTKPMFLVGSSIAKVAVVNHRQYALERLKKLPGGEFNEVEAINEITVDKLNGYEIVATGKTADDKPELVYQVMLFDDEGSYYIIVGQARENMEDNLKTYKRITGTFKRK